MANRRATGSRYEAAAADFLVRRGYEILARNFRCRYGEIDLVAKDRETVVFVEVKYRGGRGFGRGEEAVDEWKQRRIRQTARIFLFSHPQFQSFDCRFDVLAADAENKWRHYENAFGGL